MESTLLLNSSFEPIRVISWEKALTLFFLGKVEIIENYDRSVSSVSLVIKVPAVVRLLRFVNLNKRRPPLTRTNLLLRDSYQCQYCAKDLKKESATIDHVIPRSKGGKTVWENVVIACSRCNLKKGGNTPSEANMPLLSSPDAPAWMPHLYIKINTHIPSIWHFFIEGVGFNKESKKNRS